MRVLITGAAGFIGSRLVEAMHHHGHEVVGIDNLSTGRLGNYPDVVVGDITSDLPAGPFDLIYHCAASYRNREAWELDARTNVLGTLAVIREAQHSGARLVYFQTSLCYGPNPTSPVKIDAPLNPVGSYAVSKTAGEAYIRDSGLEYVSLRLANVYGPRNLSGPIPTFFQRLTEGKPCTVVDSRRDFVFIDDLVWVAVNAAWQGRACTTSRRAPTSASGRCSRRFGRRWASTSPSRRSCPVARMTWLPCCSTRPRRGASSGGLPRPASTSAWRRRSSGIGRTA